LFDGLVEAIAAVAGRVTVPVTHDAAFLIDD
jgi:hypothetical protein